MSKKTEVIINVALIGALLLVLFLLENALPSTHMLFTVLKKGAIYALVAVSMNLLNGFTGLFSLGQAGFMLVGAYTYGVLTIPVAERANVYMYFDGGIIQFALHPTRLWALRKSSARFSSGTSWVLLPTDPICCAAIRATRACCSTLSQPGSASR